MRRPSALARLLLAVAALALPAALGAHDLFWRLTAYVVPPDADARLPILSGTFSTSQNAIAWSRVADLSVWSPAGRERPDSARWDARGDTTWLTYRTGRPGTYVVGLSTHARELAMTARDFNRYLADDGVPDVLARRRAEGALERPARERYAKHVKAVFQVGDAPSDGWSTVAGYPAELVPLENPYALAPGATLRLRCLVDGRPAPGQFVAIGGRAGATGDARLPARTARCDREGVVAVRLDRPGRWYVKFIHMTPATDGTVDYVSQWASITFEVRRPR